MKTRLLIAIFAILILPFLCICAEENNRQSSAHDDASSVFSTLMGDVKIVNIATLKGGASGTGLFKVNVGNQSYILRILPENMPINAIKREIDISKKMGELGVSPKVYAASAEKRA